MIILLEISTNGVKTGKSSGSLLSWKLVRDVWADSFQAYDWSVSTNSGLWLEKTNVRTSQLLMLHGTTSDPLQTDFGNKTTINSSKDGIKGALNSESDNGGNKQIELSLDVRSCESCHVICQSDSGKHENGIFGISSLVPDWALGYNFYVKIVNSELHTLILSMKKTL